MEEVSDFKVLTELEPFESEAVQATLKTGNLPVFVSKLGAVYFKKVQAAQSGRNRSYLRALQGVIGQVKAELGKNPLSYAVTTAAWDSFQEWMEEERESEVKPATSDDTEANEKIEELLDAMVRAGASDLHIRCEEHANVTRVRLRINGVLTPYAKWNYEVGSELIRALWAHYCTDVARQEKSINHGSFYHRPISRPNSEYMLRLNEIPEDRGLKFVARIRDPKEIWELETMGYTPQHNLVMQSLLLLRKGLISINGPTNSGKSTTMSSMLASMPEDISIIEIGDPIETHQEHVDHFPLSENWEGGKIAHLEDTLGATVRQDPDIAAMTEMRDPITATAAQQLASQGKLVITTTHTTDFVSFFGRLKSLGMNPDDMGAPGFIRGVLTQYLLGKLCSHCSLERSPRRQATKRYEYIFQVKGVSGIRYRNKEGCDRCNRTGLIGRTLVAEVIEVTPDMQEIVHDIIYRNDPRRFYVWQRENKVLNVHQHARERILAGEVDPGMAEGEMSRFDESNLLWMYPTETENQLFRVG